MSVVSKTFLSSRYSHVGVVVRLAEEFGNRPLLFEATIESAVADVEDNYIKYGTQLVDLRARIDSYYGAAVWRPLVKYQWTEERRRTLREFIRSSRNKPYETSKFELVKAFFGTNTKADTNSYFCSELVAQTYIQLGILAASTPSDDYLPAFFSHELDRHLPLIGGASLDAEVVIHPWDIHLSLRDHYILSGCTPSPKALQETTEVMEVRLESGEDLTHRIHFFNLEKMEREGHLYCEVYLGLPPAQGARVCTATRKSFNPEWNEVLQVPYVRVGCKVKVEVREKRFLLDDPTIGYAVLDLGDLAPQEERRVKIRLQHGYVHAVFSRKLKSGGGK